MPSFFMQVEESTLTHSSQTGQTHWGQSGACHPRGFPDCSQQTSPSHSGKQEPRAQTGKRATERSQGEHTPTAESGVPAKHSCFPGGVFP